MQPLALAGNDARRWQPRWLRLRLLTIPAQQSTARNARTGRRRLLHLTAAVPFPALAAQALNGSPG